jgi:hypothetical protein
VSTSSAGKGLDRGEPEEFRRLFEAGGAAPTGLGQDPGLMEVTGPRQLDVAGWPPSSAAARGGQEAAQHGQLAVRIVLASGEGGGRRGEQLAAATGRCPYGIADPFGDMWVVWLSYVIVDAVIGACGHLGT